MTRSGFNVDPLNHAPDAEAAPSTEAFHRPRVAG